MTLGISRRMADCITASCLPTCRRACSVERGFPLRQNHSAKAIDLMLRPMETFLAI